MCGQTNTTYVHYNDTEHSKNTYNGDILCLRLEMEQLQQLQNLITTFRVFVQIVVLFLTGCLLKIACLFFIHCESNGISPPEGCISSAVRLHIITRSVYQKAFAMMIYNGYHR